MTSAAEDPVPTLPLVADCSRCAGLCCVALPYERSADFPVTKDAGRPCANLDADFGCRIHEQLDAAGWHGCVVFDCAGAGQQTVQVAFGGRDWREYPDLATDQFMVFTQLLQVHEAVGHLANAQDRLPDGTLRGRARQLRDDLIALAGSDPTSIIAWDARSGRSQVGRLLGEASAAIRVHPHGADVERITNCRDLIGAPLRRADLRGADLHGRCLLGADLRDADLTDVDLLGTDLRAADLRGAQVGRALFTTRRQLAAARR